MWSKLLIHYKFTLFFTKNIDIHHNLNCHELEFMIEVGMFYLWMNQIFPNSSVKQFTKTSLNDFTDQNDLWLPYDSMDWNDTPDRKDMIKIILLIKMILIWMILLIGIILHSWMILLIWMIGIIMIQMIKWYWME